MTTRPNFLQPLRRTVVLLFALFACSLMVACQQNGETGMAPDGNAESSLVDDGSTGSERTRGGTAEGECTVEPPEDALNRVCTQQYDPVCGCNGKTYSNACMAGIAGVSSSTPGACEEDRPDRT